MSSQGSFGPPQLPVGTQVVLRETGADLTGVRVQRGATGRVVGYDAAADDYLVDLTDGRRLRSPRGRLALRKAYQQQVAVGADQPALDGPELVARHTIYAAVVGSRAFGLATEESDTDLRGVYAAPASAFWSLVKPPPHVDGPEPEQFSWEVERFCELALKANPNLLEVLHSGDVRVLTPVGEELLELRPAFLSQLVFQTYSGYVLSQFRKLEADLRQHGQPRWKHVMHLLRLLLNGRDLLRHGRLVLDVGEHRDRLLAVRRGELGWPEVESWRLTLHAGLDDALRDTVLPAGPDTTRVDAWLRSVRARSARQTLLSGGTGADGEAW
ncbi:nucleotidyltransferase domain-containing protein [Plantactinospora sp. B5E13]|uniref:nucleotidyltransferase domain-containing protein n=1 Tax=unclassified Plantactinospora TaxID=2631981 RepID=UPI00325EAC78